MTVDDYVILAREALMSGDMHTRRRTQAILRELAKEQDLTKRGELIIAFSDALEQRLINLNNSAAAIMGRIENDLRDELSRISGEIAALRALMDRSIAERADFEHSVRAKTHTISNQVMGIEYRFDELAQAITMLIDSDNDDAQHRTHTTTDPSASK